MTRPRRDLQVILFTVSAVENDLPNRTSRDEKTRDLSGQFVGLSCFKPDHLRIPSELLVDRQPLRRAPAARVFEIAVEGDVDALLRPVPINGMIEQHHVSLQIRVEMD